MFPINEYLPWADYDIWRLQTLVASGTPTREIAQLLGRSERAVYAKASELGVSLYPRDPYPFTTWLYGQGLI